MTGGYLVQRFFPTLKIGIVPTALHHHRETRVHCMQGDWDSACGAYCVASAMAMLGEIGNAPAICERRYGVAARLFRQARVIYFDGTTVHQMASLIDSLQTERPVHCFRGHHDACVKFINHEFARKHLVIASWKSKHGNHHHWILIVGIEGHQIGHRFLPHALLTLDPGVFEPTLTAYNGRIELTEHASSSRSYVRYRTADGAAWMVRITSALAIGSPAKRQ